MKKCWKKAASRFLRLTLATTLVIMWLSYSSGLDPRSLIHQTVAAWITSTSGITVESEFCKGLVPLRGDVAREILKNHIITAVPAESGLESTKFQSEFFIVW